MPDEPRQLRIPEPAPIDSIRRHLVPGDKVPGGPRQLPEDPTREQVRPVLRLPVLTACAQISDAPKTLTTLRKRGDAAGEDARCNDCHTPIFTYKASDELQRGRSSRAIRLGETTGLRSTFPGEANKRTNREQLLGEADNPEPLTATDRSLPPSITVFGKVAVKVAKKI